MSTLTSTTLYPAEGWGAPKYRKGHAAGVSVGLPAGTEIFSADNHISVADDIFFEREDGILEPGVICDLVREGNHVYAMVRYKDPAWAKFSGILKSRLVAL